METRQDNDDPAVADLIDALHQVDPALKAVSTSPYDGPDLVLQAPGGAKILIEVKAARRPSPATTAALIKRTSPFDGKTHVLVADYLMPEVRRQLKDAGWSWLDRRGHLRLRADSLLLDTEVPSQVSGGPPAAPLSTRGGRDVAMLLVRDGSIRRRPTGCTVAPPVAQHCVRSSSRLTKSVLGRVFREPSSAGTLLGTQR